MLSPEQFSKLVLKEDLDRILDSKLDAKLQPLKTDILNAIDGLAKIVKDLKSESAANIAAHDRFETRITRIEKHLF